MADVRGTPLVGRRRRATPNDLLRRFGYVNWGPPEFPRPHDLAESDGIVLHPQPHEVRDAIANPEPETDPSDRDDDRLATELFRRYGSVERGLFRTRTHWVADATAVRELLAADQGFAEIVEAVASAPVRISPDPEAHFRSFNEGWDDAWAEREHEIDAAVAGALIFGSLAAIVGWILGWLIGRRRG